MSVPLLQAHLPLTLTNPQVAALQLLKIIPNDDASAGALDIDSRLRRKCRGHGEDVIDFQRTNGNALGSADNAATNETQQHGLSAIEVEDDDVQIVERGAGSGAPLNDRQPAVELEPEEPIVNPRGIKRERSPGIPSSETTVAVASTAPPSNQTSKRREVALLRLKLDANRMQQRLTALEDSD